MAGLQRGLSIIQLHIQTTAIRAHQVKNGRRSAFQRKH